MEIKDTKDIFVSWELPQGWIQRMGFFNMVVYVEKEAEFYNVQEG